MEENKNTIERIFLSCLVYNRVGVLLRVASLFARRGYNVVSLTVAETENPEHSRITAVAEVEEGKVDLVETQLQKLEDVIKVIELTESRIISSELCLVKVYISSETIKDVLKTINGVGATVRDIGINTLTSELAGTPGHIDKFIRKMSKHGIIELSRSGLTALESGDKNINGIVSGGR